MRHLFTFVFISLGAYACSQQARSTNEDKDQSGSNQTELYPIERGIFENYAFVADGEIVDRADIVDYNGVTLNSIISYDTTLQNHRYSGVLFFHTTEQPKSGVQYSEAPAYFINGRHISPENIRWSRAEAYNRMEKSIQDTLINGVQYKGSIHVDTDEDFFAGRIALSEFLNRYAGIPSRENIIVHWGPASSNRKGRDGDVSTIILDNFPLYYVNPASIRSVEMSRLQFAEGEKYVIHLLDDWFWSGSGTSHKWGTQIKARTIFADPLALDPNCPCYIADIDTTGKRIFQSTELKPEPYQGEAEYLKKLSNVMGLSEKQKAPAASDSITVQFIVTRTGMLADLESTGPDNPSNTPILKAIKRISCPWSLGMYSGRPVDTKRKMTIYYAKDYNGNIRSLNALKFKYDKG